MKTLLVLRHAKSSWNDPTAGDHERTLNKRGKRDAPRMGRLLVDEGLVPDQIVSSTAVRARETATTVAEACGYERSVELSSQLYGATPDDVRAVLRSLYYDDDRVLVVAHNPGLAEFVAQLTGQFGHFPTAALAQIELPIDDWRHFGDDVRGTLRNLWRPKELG